MNQLLGVGVLHVRIRRLIEVVRFRVHPSPCRLVWTERACPAPNHHEPFLLPIIARAEEPIIPTSLAARQDGAGHREPAWSFVPNPMIVASSQILFDLLRRVRTRLAGD